LGALTHGGEFEIKPLTLFCGENNSGKTWAMYAAYSYLRLSYLPSNRSPFDNRPFPYSSAQKIFPYKEWLEKNWKRGVTEGNKIMSDRLPEFFNADKKLLRGAKIEWGIDKDSFINSAIRRGWNFMSSDSNGQITLNKEPNAEKVEITFTGKPNRGGILSGLESFSTYIDCRRAFLAPAERCGLQLFYQELRARRTALLHHAGKKGINLDELLRDVMKSRYAKPIADYIDWLNRLSDEKPNSPYSKIAELLAIKLAGGKYRVDKEGNIFFTPQKTNGTKPEEMELHTASSTVKSMFGLWYYLSRNAKRGDVIMIDEPELNLHPANQRALARLLAQLVNAGLYVVASTHSDYIVREVNTLIMLNRKDAKRASLMKKYKISEGEVLSPTLVGAYEMSAKTGRIEPMKMDKEGINAKTLDEVIVAQGEENDEVHYSLAK
jgi:AAA15 family ATPase/GTPase